MENFIDDLQEKYNTYMEAQNQELARKLIKDSIIPTIIRISEAHRDYDFIYLQYIYSKSRKKFYTFSSDTELQIQKDKRLKNCSPIVMSCAIKLAKDEFKILSNEKDYGNFIIYEFYLNF